MDTAAGLDDPQLDAVQTGSGITPIIGLNFHLTDMINVGLKYEHHTTIELTNETTLDDVRMYPDGAKVQGRPSRDDIRWHSVKTNKEVNSQPGI